MQCNREYTIFSSSLQIDATDTRKSTAFSMCEIAFASFLWRDNTDVCTLDKVVIPVINV
jgi:hypothetical protein